MTHFVTAPKVELVGVAQARNLQEFQLEGYAYSDGEAVMEYAGRNCYQSFSRPNKATEHPDAYLRNIIAQGHESVLEHSMFTFKIEQVSRTFTHELVRHRHLSFSQQSQRYVDESDSAFVVPAALQAHFPEIEGRVDNLVQASHELYQTIVKTLIDTGLPRKQAYEAARSVLPNGTETRIVVTGNLRAWRDFLKKRLHPAADQEIQAVARQIHQALYHQNQAYVADIFEED